MQKSAGHALGGLGRSVPSQLFELKQETLAILMIDGHRVAEHIPAGTVVTVFAGALDEPHQLVDVQWEGRIVQMFAEDLRHRGIPTQAASS